MLSGARELASFQNGVRRTRPGDFDDFHLSELVFELVSPLNREDEIDEFAFRRFRRVLFGALSGTSSIIEPRPCRCFSNDAVITGSPRRTWPPRPWPHDAPIRPAACLKGLAS
jgi:hypothetical protein